MIGSAIPTRDLDRDKVSVQRRVLWLCVLVWFAGQVGCRQRAITEMYVEQMAQRNRALEDLVYDFDAENRAMEFEIEDLRRTNAQLQGRLQELQRQSIRVESSPSDRKSPTVGPNANSIDRSPTSKGSAPAPLKLGPSKNGGNLGPLKNKTEEVLTLEPPEVVLPEKSIEPEPMLPAPEPLRKPPVLPKESSSELLPEIVPESNRAPNSESLLKSAPSGLPANDADGAKEDRKIPLPPSGVIQTSANLPPSKSSSKSTDRSKPIDPKVRQIDWHPTLCRAQNTDGKPGDDGLYLVLVPRNSAGGFVPSTGALTLVVEETLADGSVARIGRYEYSPQELKEHLEPVGTSAGLHLPIRWSDQSPSGSSVDVYAKFTLEDGTTMVNRRSIPLRKLAASGSANWTPR